MRERFEVGIEVGKDCGVALCGDRSKIEVFGAGVNLCLALSVFVYYKTCVDFRFHFEFYSNFCFFLHFHAIEGIPR